MSDLSDQVSDLSSKAVSTFALVGGLDRLSNIDGEKATILFREEVISVPLKYLKKMRERLYLSQVFLEARQGRDPSHLFAKKPQTDRER